MKIDTEARYVQIIRCNDTKAGMLDYLDRLGAEILGEFDSVRGIIAKHWKFKIYCFYGCGNLEPAPRTEHTVARFQF